MYRLAIWKIGSGQVILDPPGGLYAEGTVVTLSAVPDSGWSFKNWGGALNSTNNPETIVMDGDKSIIVTFMQQTVVEETNDKLSSFYSANDCATVHCSITLPLGRPGHRFCNT